MREITIDRLEELDDVAEAVLTSLDGRNVVAFCGAMGAGKTTLISAIMRQLHSDDNVTSPTFALVNQYTVGADSRYADAVGEEVYHFDFYRINRIEEFLGVDLDDESNRLQLMFSSMAAAFYGFGAELERD